MINFLKESIKEFEHVVWPTQKETKQYFMIVTGIIVGLTIFLFIVSSILSAGLFFAKDNINPATLPQTTQQNSNSTPDLNLEDIKFDTGATK
ncbi:preprotein translocase subunit SecE [Candidatus Gracilibacteria bacterium]|nr:preprotein translocase subunit SecE [Candidatus Gracilibacteria bacterium]